MTSCVFCSIVAGDEPAEVVARGDDCLIIVPIDPVVDGHVLVIPEAHVDNATTDPAVTGYTFACAATYLRTHLVGPANLITSIGAEATQTIHHLHVHVVPRAQGDGLALPWTGQQRT